MGVVGGVVLQTLIFITKPDSPRPRFHDFQNSEKTRVIYLIHPSPKKLSQIWTIFLNLIGQRHQPSMIDSALHGEPMLPPVEGRTNVALI